MQQSSENLAQASSTKGEVTLENLLDAMANVSGSTALQGSANAMTTPTITELFDPEIMESILTSPQLAEYLPRLRKLLPEGDQDNSDNLLDVIRCHPFRSQASALTNALASGGTREVLQSFQLPEDNEAGALGAPGVQAFLRSLLALARREPGNGAGSSSK